MRPSLERALFADYPVFFVEAALSARDSSMARGLCCGDGWEPIVRRVAAAAERIRLRHGVIIHCTQAKEKFGSLRIHHRVAGSQRLDDRFMRIVVAVDSVSLRVCEVCGADGRLAVARGRVYRTLCAEHLSRRAVADYEAAHAEPWSAAEIASRTGCELADAELIRQSFAAPREVKSYDPAHDFIHLSPGTQAGDEVPGFTLSRIWPLTKNPSPAGDERGTP